MKSLSYLLLAVPLFLFYSCEKNENLPAEPERKSEVLTGEITANKQLDPQTDYLLRGKVYVKNNATLTIPAGITIKAEAKDAPNEKSALIVTRGSKLVITGTAHNPVVFTSAATVKKPGDWIGIVILGNAPVNMPKVYARGLEENEDTRFGGQTADDNSGSLSYLRIECAGGLNPPQEEEWEMDMVAGLSLNGVGSGTNLDHIMVAHSRDDGFQFVGGTVNGRYLISAYNGDDSFDFDRGYTGKLQFLIGYHKNYSNFAIRSNGIETLNDKDASKATPFSRPIISNSTIIGPEETNESNQSQGVYIRKNTRFLVQNSIIAGYSGSALMVCSKTKPILIQGTGSAFRFNVTNSDNPNNVYMYDSGPTGTDITPDKDLFRYGSQTGKEVEKVTFNNNTIIEKIEGIKIKSLYTANPDFSLIDGSPALTGADFSDEEYSSFFTKVPFKGAIGTDNWAKGKWVEW